MPVLAPLLVVAAVSYGCSVLLGVLVATRRLDSSGFHWLHHALYVCTFVLAAATVVVSAWQRDAAGWLLAPTLIAFAFIPFLGTRGLRHRVVGSAPAPFYLAALVLLALT